MSVYIYLSTHPSIYPSIRPSICPSVHPPICPSVHPLIHPSTRLYTYPSIRPPVCPSIHPSILPSTHPSVRPSVRPSVQPPTHPSVHLHPLRAASIPRPSLHLSVRPSTVRPSVPFLGTPPCPRWVTDSVWGCLIVLPGTPTCGAVPVRVLGGTSGDTPSPPWVPAAWGHPGVLNGTRTSTDGPGGTSSVGTPSRCAPRVPGGRCPRWDPISGDTAVSSVGHRCAWGHP